MDDRPHIVVVEDEVTQRDMLVDYYDCVTNRTKASRCGDFRQKQPILQSLRSRAIAGFLHFVTQSYYLSRHQFPVNGVENGTALRNLVDRELPSLVMLDVGLPGEDGFALARWLRERSGRIGIIMVTAASDTVDRVVGLETGADDYIAKPFEPRELLARVKSVLRRAVGGGTTPVTATRVRMGRRVLDLERRVLGTPGNDTEDKLSASEFDLLKVFAENPNRPLMRDWLLEAIAHRETEAFDRSIDLRITRLRRKIEVDPAHPEAIRTVRGVGYMFVPPKD